jgi:hypothetical protein
MPMSIFGAVCFMTAAFMATPFLAPVPVRPPAIVSAGQTDRLQKQELF